MSHTLAILAGVLLIAASVVTVSVIRPAAAMTGGPYVLMHHSNTSALAGVFRLDTSSGEVSYCYLAGKSGADLACTPSVR